MSTQSGKERVLQLVNAVRDDTPMFAIFNTIARDLDDLTELRSGSHMTVHHAQAIQDLHAQLATERARTDRAEKRVAELERWNSERIDRSER